MAKTGEECLLSDCSTNAVRGKVVGAFGVRTRNQRAGKRRIFIGRRSTVLAVLHQSAMIFYDRSPVVLELHPWHLCMFLLIHCADMTTQTQDLSQALVLSDNQFPPSFVQDSQPMSKMARDSEVFASDSIYVPVVPVQQTPAAAAATAKERRMGKWYAVFIDKAPMGLQFMGRSRCTSGIV
ncbi:Translational activator GCN1 [Hordeum vulgare]|nr:Translational activator GCN1 [Hordeum vulgare]